MMRVMGGREGGRMRVVMGMMDRGDGDDGNRLLIWCIGR